MAVGSAGLKELLRRILELKQTIARLSSASVRGSDGFRALPRKSSVLYRRIAVMEGFEECVCRRSSAAETEVYKARDIYYLQRKFAMSYE